MSERTEILEIFDKAQGCRSVTVKGEGADFDRMVRLVRLGLWAEEHGIQALKRFESFACQTEDSFRESHIHGFKMEMPAKEALEKLPKAEW